MSYFKKIATRVRSKEVVKFIVAMGCIDLVVTLFSEATLEVIGSGIGLSLVAIYMTPLLLERSKVNLSNFGISETKDNRLPTHQLGKPAQATKQFITGV